MKYEPPKVVGYGSVEQVTEVLYKGGPGDDQDMDAPEGLGSTVTDV